MSVLKKQVTAGLGTRKQGELAACIAEEEPRKAASTVEKQLAQIGSLEGRDFFLKAAARLARLAKELGVAIDDVRAWADAPTLLLGPGLPPAFLEFVRQDSENQTRFDLIECSSKEELRDAAAAEATPILVLKSREQFREFFAGAGLSARMTEASQVPRGWRLTEFPDLLKVPPPREPAWFAPSGEPLFRNPDAWRRRVNADEEEVLVPLPDFCRESDLVERDANGRSNPNAWLLSWAYDQLWSWDHVERDDIATIVAPHARPRALKPLFLETISGLNPIRAKENLSRLLEAARLPEHSSMDDSYFRLPEFQLDAVVRCCTEDEEQQPRDLLDSLLDREWSLPTTRGSPLDDPRLGNRLKEPRSLAEAVHVLRAVSAADWVTLAAPTGVQWLIDANLGAGHRAAVRLWSFPKDAPTPIVESTASGMHGRLFDGGDVVLYLNLGTSTERAGARCSKVRFHGTGSVEKTIDGDPSAVRGDPLEVPRLRG